MNVIVNTSATRASGALTIYRQFIEHLSLYTRGDRYIIFVDSSMPQPDIEGVEYIADDNHSWRHRIFWDYYGCQKWLKIRGIKADVIVSLQNSGIITHCRQVIYYHQPLPFYKKSWSFFKSTERGMALYKYLYPIIIGFTYNKNTDIVVQIPFIKKGFLKRFKATPDKVHVMFPDIENIEPTTAKPALVDKNKIHFLYPATYNPYKEHKTIVEALGLVKQKDAALLNNIRVHFTLSKSDAPDLMLQIKEKRLEDNFIFNGRIPHDDLLSLYKIADGLLFPSTIETLGLPLLEAAKFGLPILASDLPYAKEVLEGYDGANFIDATDYDAWARHIESIATERKKHMPLTNKASSWPEFFELIHPTQPATGVSPLGNIEPLPTLYILGNGFDKAHGIASSYGDFKAFVQNQGNQRLIGLMDTFFSNQTDFWSDVEKALGDYDENAIIDYCNPEEEFDVDHPTRSQAALEDSPDFVFQPLLDEFKDSFTEWVDSININKVYKLFHLNKEAYYLTFNYTETLENVYGIPESQICHIHGSRKLGDTYVVGHAKKRATDSSYVDSDLYFVNDTREKIIEWMNDLYKDCPSIISRNEKFFDTIKDIKQIFVIGHSLNEVDHPYIEKIAQNAPDAKWYFCFYDSKDVEAINKFVAKQGLKNIVLIATSDLIIQEQ